MNMHSKPNPFFQSKLLVDAHRLVVGHGQIALYSSNWAGSMVLRTHSALDGGQIRATILPLMSPSGIGP